LESGVGVTLTQPDAEDRSDHDYRPYNQLLSAYGHQITLLSACLQI
jgi:hypothetical protein